ncbi:hypothetical protein ACRRTK_021860 [Alexandromys fortis]
MKTFPPYGIATEQLLGSALFGNSTDVPIVVSMRRQEMSAGNKPRDQCNLISQSYLSLIFLVVIFISRTPIVYDHEIEEEQKTTQGCIDKEIKYAGTAFVEVMLLAGSQCVPEMEN